MEQFNDNLLSQIASAESGLGTSRNGATNYRPSSYKKLVRAEIAAIYRGNRICRNIVDSIPDKAKNNPFIYTTNVGQDTLSYYERFVELDFPTWFAKAVKVARLEGDCFLFLDFNDGRPIDQPVDWRMKPELTNIYLRGQEYVRLTPINNLFWDDGVEVEVVLAKGLFEKVHPTRYLRFSGLELVGSMLDYNQGFHDDVLSSCFQQIAQFFGAVEAGSTMLAQHSLFKMEMSGLGEHVKTKGSDYVTQRFVALQRGMSVVKGLLLDADTEKAEFITRSYSGVETLINTILDAMVMVSGIPRTQLIMTPNIGAFSESAMMDEIKFSDIVQLHQQDQWSPNVKKILPLLADYQEVPKGQVKFNNPFRQLEKDKAALYKTYAEGDRLYSEMGVLQPDDIGSRFTSDGFRGIIEKQDKKDVDNSPTNDVILKKRRRGRPPKSTS